MFIILGAVIGLVIGSAILQLPGAFFGAITGALAGAVISLRDSVGKQQQQLLQLTEKLNALEQRQHTASTEKEPEAQPPVRAARVPLADRLGSVIHDEQILTDENLAAALAEPATESTATKSPLDNSASTTYNNVAINSWQIKPTEKVKTKPSVKLPPELAKLSDLLAKINLVTRVGIVVLFFGVAFLLKYATENVSVPIEVRLVSIALGALMVFVIGWRIRDKRKGYAVLLQGAAVGIWYLVTFTALKMYALLPPSVGFFVLFALSVFAALISVKQDAKSLSVFGILGGFLAPILASTGSGSHVMLFSYYAILNLGILSIVWFRAWRSLTLMGFIFTFVIGVIWGVTQYKASLFASTEPFLLLFILFYIAVVMIFALRKRWPPTQLIDGPILFGTPVIGFTLQGTLVQNFEYGLAWSALGFGLTYLGITALWWRTLTERSLLLRESFLAIGLVFVSLTIPFAFDKDVTALLWALEGAGALWLAVRQQRNWGCLLALLAQLGAGLSWLADSPSAGEQLFLNAAYLTATVIALVALFGAWLLQSQPTSFWCKKLHIPVLVWGLLWWFGAAAWQFENHLAYQYLPAATLIFVSASCLLLQWLRIKFEWTALIPVLLALLPVCGLTLLASHHFVDHPSASLGFIAWPLSAITLYWIYSKAKIFVDSFQQVEKIFHFITYFLCLVVIGWEVLWQIRQHTYLNSWQFIGVGAVGYVGIVVACKYRFWSESLNALYREQITALLFVGLLFNILCSCLLQPNVHPLPYIPLLNPLDLWQIVVIVSFAAWWKSEPDQITKIIPAKTGWLVIAGIVFIYINTLLLRTLHVVADIPFSHYALFNSDLVQAACSILWTSLGIALLFAANRLAKREIWMVGMALFGVVVVKLFVIDLANSGTVERIVSFMVVGLLLLGAGYLIPKKES